MEETDMNNSETVCSTHFYVEKDLSIEENLLQYLEMVKLATAIAIINAKPSNVTCEEFTVELASKLANKLSRGSIRCHDVEEFFRSIREQLVQQVKANLGNDSTQHSHNSQNELVSQIDVDKICSFSTCEAVGFMKAILLINSIVKNCSKNAEITQPMYDAIENSISCIFNYLRSVNGLKISEAIVDRSIEVIHSLFGLNIEQMEEIVTRSYKNEIDCLVQDIMTTNDVCVMDMQKRRSYLIKTIAKSPKVTFHVMLELICHVVRFHNALKQRTLSNSRTERFATSIDNIYYVLQSLEDVLSTALYQKTNSVSRFDAAALDLHWQTALQGAMDHVTANFTMFAMYLGRIHCLIEMLVH